MPFRFRYSAAGEAPKINFAPNAASAALKPANRNRPAAGRQQATGLK